MTVAVEDVRFLLESADRHLARKFDKSEIVSMRCGIRPLVIRKEVKQARYPLDLSRRQHVVSDQDLPWISSYGGKITGCREMADKITKEVARKIRPTGRPVCENSHRRDEDVEYITWPGIEEKVPSPAWCAGKELCCTLEDYLRRRTNISQWMPRQGLGWKSEYRQTLVDAATEIDGMSGKADEIVDRYEKTVRDGFDRLLEGV